MVEALGYDIELRCVRGLTHFSNTRLLILWHLSDALRPNFYGNRAESLDLSKKDFQKSLCHGVGIIRLR